MPRFTSSSVALGTQIEQGELELSIRYGLFPVGAIAPWAKSITGVPTIPTGWMECDGSTVSDADSPINGQAVPDIQAGEYLRGGTTSGTTGGAATHEHECPIHFTGANDIQGDPAFGTGGNQSLGQQYLNDASPGGSVAAAETETVNNEPPYYEIVWIIRYK